MPSVPSLSVVLSFYNEAENIPELVKRLSSVLKQLVDYGKLSTYELIFVNDASTDGSRAMLESMIGKKSDIRLINMSRNFGVSPCVIAGMQHATGDFVVYMDADLQDPPEVIPRMLEAWQQDQTIDVVHTVRNSRAGETWLKLVLTRLGYWILKHVSTITLQIEAGDFKMLSRRAVNHLVQLKEKRPYMRGLVSWIGFKQASISYNRDARYAGETHFFIFSTKVISNFFSSALIAFSDLPLQFSSWLGATVSTLSVCYSCWLGIELLRGLSIPDWSLPLAILSFIGGVQLFSIGMLGLYIASIHVESKKRPNYIIESIYGFPKKSKQQDEAA